MVPGKTNTKQPAFYKNGSATTSLLLRGVMIIGALMFLVIEGSAQLCSGSLGDPIVNITFGSGANPGPPLHSSITGYDFVTNDCPDDGDYTLRNNTTACFGSSWHSLSMDHTGDPQGYFMLVNASFQPSDFYVDTVRNLCSNTTYEFAAWLMNVVNRASSIMPNITFSIEKIDGTVLQAITTGLISSTSSPQWKQYGFWFSTPPGVQTVVLRITNNAPGGIGNDLALDDITFRPCGPKVAAYIINNSDSIDICEDEPLNFTLHASSITGYTNPAFQWQSSRDSGKTWNDIPGATDLMFTARPQGLGKFLYRLTIAEQENFVLKPCRIASNRLVISVHPLPEVEAGPDIMMIKDYTSVLSGSVQGANLSYSWSPERFLSDPNVLDPSVSPTEDIVYTLTARSKYGCTSSDVLSVKVADALFIPNAFTPNNDGINDTWRIPFLDPFLEAEVSVYNRYGQRVYHNSGALVSWDGRYQNKQLATGVYVYTVRIKKEGKLLRGTVSIVR